MFTAEQIKDAHSKVKTGADFPQYAQDLSAMGVSTYNFEVEQGINKFFGKDNHVVALEPTYPHLAIADDGSKEKLTHTISIHQQGQTDFPTFCKQAGEAGVWKWKTDLENKVVIYYDKAGKEILAEPIKS